MPQRALWQRALQTFIISENEVYAPFRRDRRRAREGCYNLGHSHFTAIKTFVCWLLLLEGC